MIQRRLGFMGEHQISPVDLAATLPYMVILSFIYETLALILVFKH